jgi:hypothetical protein
MMPDIYTIYKYLIFTFALCLGLREWQKRRSRYTWFCVGALFCNVFLPPKPAGYVCILAMLPILWREAHRPHKLKDFVAGVFAAAACALSISLLIFS